MENIFFFILFASVCALAYNCILLVKRIKDLEEWHDTVLAALQDFDDYDLYE